jgi:hypothetical protein
MADTYALEQSLLDQDNDFLMQQLQYTYITDSNSSSYQQTISWDCAGISNSGKYFDATQSFLTIPLVMTLASTGGAITDSVENAFAASLKNGFSNLIHSMEIQASNNAVVSTMSYSGMMINYKLMTGMSQDDTVNLAPTIHFAKDDALGTTYESAPSAKGLGECNNRIKPSVFDPTSGYGKTGFGGSNKGRLDRMINTSYDPTQTGESIANLNQTGKNYCVRDPNGKFVNWNILVNIPLTLLSDYFAKTPMVKGVYYRITLNLNVGCTTQMSVANGTFTSVSTSSQNGVVPYMISPIGVGQGLDVGTSTGLELSIAIARNSINKTGQIFSHPTMSSSRLYAAMYDMTPAAEQMYLSKLSTKSIMYDDYLSFQTLNVPPNGNFNQILTNSIARGRKLIGIPVLTENYAGANGTISPLASPFSTSPCTTARNAITNFNVLISGSNLYQSNLSYTFEQFQNELRKEGINGGGSLGMSSGLISANDFENGYRFIVADLSRTVSQSTDDISRSIQVIGTNTGDKPISIYWFLVFQRTVEMDVQTGSLIA